MDKPIKCGNCGKEGHNLRTCTASVTGETSWQRRVRTQKEKQPAFPTERVANAAAKGFAPVRGRGRARGRARGGRGAAANAAAKKANEGPSKATNIP
ncbi:hypothetical protein ACMD2_23869 [Ananas comosus]|uniref:CCHC-type domain-containing protein n=1 Tax=Ananas comosus TaxID=4615 RepID=A0A199VU48_ANACO|nr:hypothetical protein ACMD2_23869 [Ananas comosus]